MRHHYIPQFLIKAWVKYKDGKIEVVRLDLDGFPTSRRSPKHTGYEDDLYALTKEVVAHMDKQAIEKQFLMRVDNGAARVRDKLERQGLKSLTDEDKVDWVRFLMSLRIRHPHVISDLKKEGSEQLKIALNRQPEEYEVLAAEDDPETLEEWTERQYPGLSENFGLSIFHEIVDNPNIGNKILGMKWSLWDLSDSPNELLLCDQPIIFTSGIDDNNSVVALPISPTKIFIATRNDEILRSLAQIKPKDLVNNFNESIINQANARIYASDNSSVRFIKNRRSILKNK